MSKELEALESIKKFQYCVPNFTKPFRASPMQPYKNFIQLVIGNTFKEELNIIETALKEGEEAKKKNQIIRTRFGELDNKCCALLLEKQENEKKLKALEIITEKQLDMYQIMDIIGIQSKFAVEMYNKDKDIMFQITIEEFDLLKEVLLCK